MAYEVHRVHPDEPDVIYRAQRWGVYPTGTQRAVDYALTRGSAIRKARRRLRTEAKASRSYPVNP